MLKTQEYKFRIFDRTSYVLLKAYDCRNALELRMQEVTALLRFTVVKITFSDKNLTAKPFSIGIQSGFKVAVTPDFFLDNQQTVSINQDLSLVIAFHRENGELSEKNATIVLRTPQDDGAYAGLGRADFRLDSILTSVPTKSITHRLLIRGEKVADIELSVSGQILREVDDDVMTSDDDTTLLVADFDDDYIAPPNATTQIALSKLRTEYRRMQSALKGSEDISSQLTSLPADTDTALASALVVSLAATTSFSERCDRLSRELETTRRGAAEVAQLDAAVQALQAKNEFLEKQILEQSEIIDMQSDALHTNRNTEATKAAVNIRAHELLQASALKSGVDGILKKYSSDIKQAQDEIRSLRVELEVAREQILSAVAVAEALASLAGDDSLPSRLHEIQLKSATKGQVTAKLVWERDDLLHRNQELVLQMLALLGRKPGHPDVGGQAFAEWAALRYLARAQLAAGCVGTPAAAFASQGSDDDLILVLEMQRELLKLSAVTAAQEDKLRQAEQYISYQQLQLREAEKMLAVAPATNAGQISEGDLQTVVADLESELEESRSLANVYYEKLKEGSAYLVAVRAQHEKEMDTLKIELADARASIGAVGLPVVGDSTVAEIEAELQDEREKVVELEEKVQRGRAYVEKMKVAFAETNKEIERLNEELTGKDASMAELQQLHTNSLISVDKAAAVEDALRQSQADVATSTERLRSCEADNSRLSAELTDVRREVADMYAVRETLSAAQSRIAKLEAQLASVPPSSAMSELSSSDDSKIAILEAKVVELDTALAESNSLANVYYDKLKQGSEYLQQMRAQLKEVTVELEQLKRSSPEKTSSDPASNEYEEELQQARALIADFGSRMSRGSAILSQLRQDHASLLQERDRLSAELVAARGEIVALQESSTASASAVGAEDRSEKILLRQQVLDLKSQLDISSTEIEALQTELLEKDSLLSEVQTSKVSHISQLETDNANLMSQLDQARVTLARVEEEVNRLVGTVATASSRTSSKSGVAMKSYSPDPIFSLQFTPINASSGIKSGEVILESVKAGLVKLTDANKEQEERLAKKEAEVHKMTDELTSLKTQLAQIPIKKPGEHDDDALLQELIVTKMKLATLSHEMEDSRRKMNEYKTKLIAYARNTPGPAVVKK